MTSGELVHYFIDRVHRGHITFDQIRPELMQRGVAEDEIRSIVRKVDEELQNRFVKETNKGSFDQLVLIGIVVTAIGLIFTIGSFAGLFSSGSSFVVVIAYGPVIAGLVILFSGLRRRQRKRQQKFGSRMHDRQTK